MNKKHLSLLLSLMITAPWGVVSADSYKDKMEVGVRGGLLLLEGNSKLDDGWLIGPSIGHYLTDHWKVDWSLLFGGTERDTAPNQNGDVILPTAELQYHFGKSKWRPYLALGVGLLDIDIDNIGDDRSNIVLPMGPGVKYHFSEDFFANLEARYLLGVGKGDPRNDAYITAGLSYLFTWPEEQQVSAAPDPEPVEEPVLLVENLDNDGDGVLNDVDLCPNTSPGVIVVENGCPPLPKEGEEVEIRLDIKFETDKWDIRPAFVDRIYEVIEFLKVHDTVVADIEGHTDSLGSRAYNIGLSQRRADSVREFIILQGGIAPERIKSIGFGPDKPIADNKTDEGRLQNRRAVATLRAMVF